MALVGQTITVVNQSGKIVSTSKHLLDVFKEAKSAYLEKKAELLAARNGTSPKGAQQQITLPPRPTITYEPTEYPQSARHQQQQRGEPSHRTSRRRRSQEDTREPKPAFERGYSDSFYANDAVRRAPSGHVLPENSAEGSTSTRRSGVRREELLRQQSEIAVRGPEVPLRRSLTVPVNGDHSGELQAEDAEVDMDLAYGEMPPPLPESRIEDEAVLKTKMSAVNRVLEELNCLQFSAHRTIKNLEEKPEAMAAVALALAEISNLVTKMAPGALASLKGSFPAVVALLASPEFLIAAGVGVGITIVALGGYKIIKRIKGQEAGLQKAGGAERQAMLFQATLAAAPPAASSSSPRGDLELEQLANSDISRIEHWRRGITDFEAQSVGTSVEGELATPMAAERLRADRIIPPSTAAGRRQRKQHQHTSHHHHHHHHSTSNSNSNSSNGSTSRSRHKKQSASSSAAMPSGHGTAATGSPLKNTIVRSGRSQTHREEGAGRAGDARDAESSRRHSQTGSVRSSRRGSVAASTDTGTGTSTGHGSRKGQHRPVKAITAAPVDGRNQDPAAVGGPLVKRSKAGELSGLRMLFKRL